LFSICLIQSNQRLRLFLSIPFTNPRSGKTTRTPRFVSPTVHYPYVNSSSILLYQSNHYSCETRVVTIILCNKTAATPSRADLRISYRINVMPIAILRLCFTPRDVCLRTSLRLYTCVGLVLRSCIPIRLPGLTMKVTCFTPIMSFAILFHILCCVP